MGLSFIGKLVQDINLQTIATFIDAKEPISVAGFLEAFTISSNTNWILEKSTSSVLPIFVQEAISIEWNRRLWTMKSLPLFTRSVCNNRAYSQLLLHSNPKVAEYPFRKVWNISRNSQIRHSYYPLRARL